MIEDACYVDCGEDYKLHLIIIIVRDMNLEILICRSFSNCPVLKGGLSSSRQLWKKQKSCRTCQDILFSIKLTVHILFLYLYSTVIAVEGNGMFTSIWHFGALFVGSAQQGPHKSHVVSLFFMWAGIQLETNERESYYNFLSRWIWPYAYSLIKSKSNISFGIQLWVQV